MFTIIGIIMWFLFAMGIIIFAFLIFIKAQEETEMKNKRINKIWTEKEEKSIIEKKYFSEKILSSMNHLFVKNKIKNKYIHNYHLPSTENKNMILNRTTKFTKQHVIFCRLGFTLVDVDKTKNIPYSIFLSKSM